MLAMHKDVQDKLVDEIKGVIGVGEDVTESHLHQVPYLEMVIKETMQLFPFLPIHCREVTKDIELEKFTIPAGVTLVVSVYNTQRNVNNWGSDADKFRPERFHPENYSNIHRLIKSPICFSKAMKL